MTDFQFRGATAIAGIGATDFSRDSGRSELILALQAIHAALDDAGLKPSDVDGLVRWSVGSSLEWEVAACLGIRDLAFWGDVGEHGTAGGGLVAHAAAAVHAGIADVVVVYRGLNGRSGRRYGRGEVTGRGGAGIAQFTEPFGILTPQHMLAMQTRRRMHETGVTSRQFGAAAVAVRSHANRNPNAILYKSSLTLEEHQRSRLVVDPFHLFDCCLETDAGGAIVIVSAERARHLKRPPAYIRAVAQGTVAPNYIDTPAVSIGPRLWRQAGLAPSDVDVVQVYDHFSPYVIFTLEDYGFCKRGEGGAFVESGGATWPDGSLPVNTSGGHLSEVYLQGMNLIVEGVRQLRGESTSQVADAAVSFVDTANGAMILTKER